MYVPFVRHLAILLSMLLAVFPVFADPAAAIGVVRSATGTARINGLPLPSGTNVYHGDQLTTEQGTILLYIGTEERIHLAPNSLARLTKDGESNVLSLERGTVTVRTVGGTRTTIEKYGVEIRGRDDSLVVIQVALLNPRVARISAIRGSLEVEVAEKSTVVEPGHTAMITVDSSQEPKGSGAGAGLTEGQKVAITILVAAGIAAAVVIPIVITRGEGEAVSPSTL